MGHVELSTLRCKGNLLLEMLGRRFLCMLLVFWDVSAHGFAAANIQLHPLEILGNEDLSAEGRARRVLRERNLCF